MIWRAALLALAATASDASAEILPSWVAQRDAKGWEFLGASEESALFMRKIADNKAWRRFESPQPVIMYGKPYRSTLGLAELDCAGGRLRDLQQALYEQNDMAGTPDTHVAPADLPWTHPIPGTLDETFLKAACR
ncbi:surface-adhesin E family protein [Phenylobacterium terrae]|uniref:Surface-adhesin E family protein n=1 Tax=Phenylobacterium terrae TaxID=2665495 RepID=A0ABW4N6L2_9CAUL